MNYPDRDIRGWLPWELRFQALRGTSHKQLKSEGTPNCHCPVKFFLSHCSVSPKYTWSWHILFISVQPCMHVCTGITFSLDWMPSFTWVWTFIVQEFTVPLPHHARYSACKYVTASNASKLRSHLGQVAYKGRRAPAWWQTKENTCSLETHLRPNNSLNNPLCPSPSGNTHWVLQCHYLQPEMTRHNPNPGRSF